MESEHQRVEAAVGGAPAGFAELVTRSRPQVERVVARMLPRDEVDDVVQEAVVRAYLGLSRLRDPDRFTSWLCGIAVNLAKMRLRRRAVEGRLVVGGAAVSEGVDDRELLAVVRDAVGLLPPGQREVVLLHYVDDLSCEEIARLLGTSPGAVRVRLHRARAQLRRELAPLAPVPAPRPKEKTMVEMRLDDVLVRVGEEDSEPVGDGRVILLREEGGERLLPIWIGPAEGNALAVRLRDAAPPHARPMSSDLMVELVRALGGSVERVAITALREKIFYGSVAVGGEELDARPSDAINLAVRTGAPILVDEAVLEEAAVAPGEVADELARKDPEGIGGRWTSLSAELLAALPMPWPK